MLTRWKRISYLADDPARFLLGSLLNKGGAGGGSNIAMAKKGNTIIANKILVALVSMLSQHRTCDHKPGFHQSQEASPSQKLAPLCSL